ncbi:MAG: uridine kinase [Myxococcota bacterium]|nr:uridine kinase [Myxococcota bacterium]
MTKPKPLVVGIAGGTGSGKSTVAANIAAGIPSSKIALIDHDSYYKDHSELTEEERQLVNYDHPESLDNDLMIEHIKALVDWKPAEIPVYDFVTHSRKTETRRVEPADVIIVEGILTFVDARLRDLMEVKIFVDTDADIRVMRRIRRDMEHRGREFGQIREQYYKTVRPMHLQFVEPSKRWADLIIPEGGNNRVALSVMLGKLLRFIEMGERP